MRLYPSILLAAQIALASSARTRLTFHSKTNKTRTALANERLVPGWLTEECKKRVAVNEMRREYMGLKGWDDIFYLGMMISGLVMFTIFTSSYCGCGRDGNSEGTTQEQEDMPFLSVFQCFGILLELQNHRKDLWNQMDRLASKHSALLKATLASKNSRAEQKERLKELLKDKLEKEDTRQSEGVKALLFFLFELGEAEDYLHNRMPPCFGAFGYRIFISIVLVIVVLFQSIFATYIFWDGSKDFYCATLGSKNLIEDPATRCRALAKLVVVFIVIVWISRCHFKKVDYVSTPDRIPINYWTRLGGVMYFVSTAIAITAANMVIWVPMILVNIVGDALICLAIYHLNDLTVFVVFSKPDLLREWACEMNERLEYCPLRISDFVNDGVTEDRSLFVIETDEQSGKLLKFDCDESPHRQCETRLVRRPDGPPVISQVGDREKRIERSLWRYDRLSWSCASCQCFSSRGVSKGMIFLPCLFSVVAIADQVGHFFGVTTLRESITTMLQ